MDLWRACVARDPRARPQRGGGTGTLTGLMAVPRPPGASAPAAAQGALAAAAGGPSNGCQTMQRGAAIGPSSNGCRPLQQGAAAGASSHGG